MSLVDAFTKEDRTEVKFFTVLRTGKAGGTV